MNQILLVTSLLIASSFAQPPNDQEMHCQEYGTYCGSNGGFPSCCFGLKCQSNKCVGMDGNGNNFNCARTGERCDRQSCCPGTYCNGSGFNRFCQAPDFGNVECANRGENCRYRNCCRGLNCRQYGDNESVCA